MQKEGLEMARPILTEGILWNSPIQNTEALCYDNSEAREAQKDLSHGHQSNLCQVKN